jgi:monovalent cation/hydrogen antiporter
MYPVELVLALLVVVVALRALAPALRLPYPILLVLGGLVLALVPAVPDVVLAPDLVFLLFLPPLLYAAAYDTSIRDVRANLRPILSLAVGLVLATTGAVAVVVHAVLPALGWPIAFALFAIVSPPRCCGRSGCLSRPGRAFIMLSSHRLETWPLLGKTFGFLLQAVKHRSHRYTAW